MNDGREFYVSDLFFIIRSKIRNLPEELIERLGRKRFLKEHGTIAINFGRRYGHTELAKKILKHYEDSLVILPTWMASRLYPSELKERVHPTFKDDELFLLCREKIVVVDNATDLKRRFIKRLYEESDAKIIILLE